jgi:hypothetical protein
MFALVSPRQFQILVRRFPRFLNESVKEDHPAFPIDVKEHARNPVLR